MTSGPARLLARAMVAAAFLAMTSAASAQGWYYVNNQAASPAMAQMMAARGLPFGNYWLQSNGNWGFAGNPDVVGNVHGRQPSLSERGRLYSPGELMR